MENLIIDNSFIYENDYSFNQFNDKKSHFVHSKRIEIKNIKKEETIEFDDYCKQMKIINSEKLTMKLSQKRINYNINIYSLDIFELENCNEIKFDENIRNVEIKLLKMKNCSNIELLNDLKDKKVIIEECKNCVLADSSLSIEPINSENIEIKQNLPPVQQGNNFNNFGFGGNIFPFARAGEPLGDVDDF